MPFISIQYFKLMISLTISLSFMMSIPISINFEFVFICSFLNINISLKTYFSFEIHHCPFLPIIPVSIQLNTIFGINTWENYLFTNDFRIMVLNQLWFILLIKRFCFGDINFMRIELIKTFSGSYKCTTKFRNYAGGSFFNNLAILFVSSIIMC